jgi:2-oxoglutarate dehydrogenase complex dehydrogenase (E1) component-like enzyme
MKADWRAHLEGEFDIGQSYKPNKADWLDGQWSGLRTADNQDEQRRGKTAVPLKQLRELGKKLSEVPADFKAHRTIQRFMDNRAKMIESGEGIDWAMAEALAFGRWSRKAPRSACRARMSSAARSRSAIRFSTTRRPRNATFRSPMWRPTRRATK